MRRIQFAIVALKREEEDHEPRNADSLQKLEKAMDPPVELPEKDMALPTS